MKQRTYPVLKLEDVQDAESLQQKIREISGVTQAIVDFNQKTLSVEFDNGMINIVKIKEQIQTWGYDIDVETC